MTEEQKIIQLLLEFKGVKLVSQDANFTGLHRVSGYELLKWLLMQASSEGTFHVKHQKINSVVVDNHINSSA